MSKLDLNMWERALVWRKRQMVETQIENEIYVSPSQRNQVLEEVASEIQKMTVFGQDTIDSFTVYIRNMKK
jgi:hypothetical protein